ncbi:MAG: hypothetical protein HOP96_10670 [Sphingomonas sp.]|nr:hypothetical protein [Sphingomonas sp.]
MSSSRIRLAALAVPLAMLSACNTVNPQTGSMDPAFGEAVKYDQAVQTINPDPVYAADAAQPGDHGDKGAAAVKRYRTDAVKSVEAVQTTGGGGGPK